MNQRDQMILAGCSGCRHLDFDGACVVPTRKSTEVGSDPTLDELEVEWGSGRPDCPWKAPASRDPADAVAG